MKLDKIISRIESVLDPKSYDDVSNNGIQIARSGDEVKTVAFAVDASVASVKAAAAAGAQLLVVHHGISWGGGIKRIDGGVYNVVKAAVDANIALYAVHLPLDADRKVGNNHELARSFSLKRVKPAFSYHGNVIGVVGYAPDGRKVGICSGGAGCFAEEAKRLGCDVYLTGEADWGEKIAADNVGMQMTCAGHYETETYGVRALMRHLAEKLKVKTVFVGPETGKVKLP
jgi:putative NIF3 family GTP cyclohydrolase 1 type 2